MLILLLFFLQIIDQVNDESTNQVSFSVEKILTLRDTVDGYYESISVRGAKDGHYFVLDAGNVRIYKYDSSGKQLLVFGKEGNGPGEISGWGSFYVTDNFLVKSANRGFDLTVFDLNGKFIQQLKMKEQYAKLIFSTNDSLFIHYGFDYNRKKTYEYYLFDGQKFYSDTKNTVGNFTPQSAKDFEKHVEISFKKDPFSIIKMNSFYYGTFKGNYKIGKFSISGDQVAFKTRVVDRIKRKPYYNFEGQKISKETKAFYAKLEKQYLSLDGGYKNDIAYLAGSSEGYIFLVRPTINKSTLKLDVLNANLDYINQIKMEIPDFESVQEVKNGKLIVRCKNDTKGLYVNVYKITSKQ